jgi:hypothetical protein
MIRDSKELIARGTLIGESSQQALYFLCCGTSYPVQVRLGIYVPTLISQSRRGHGHPTGNAIKTPPTADDQGWRLRLVGIERMFRRSRNSNLLTYE